MPHVQTIPSRRAAQLTELAQLRGHPRIPPQDRQMIEQLWYHDAEVYGPMTDKEFEMIQTLADRYLIEVVS